MAAGLQAARCLRLRLVIDIGGLRSDNAKDRVAVGAGSGPRASTKASSPSPTTAYREQLVRDVFDEAAAFFALPVEQKLRGLTENKANRGY